MTERFVWRERHVVDASPAALVARTYREHRDTRALLASVLAGRRPKFAIEIGCGYGRMTPLLAEVAERVVGLEREPHLVEEAARLYPDIAFQRVADLTVLPIESQTVDLVLTFTVLQHQLDGSAQDTATEIRRILRPHGLLLLCEETDPSQREIDYDGAVATIGRSIDWYGQCFKPLRLIEHRPREIEPTYPRRNVGHYMLFGR